MRRPLGELLGNEGDERLETHWAAAGHHWGLPVQIPAQSAHGKPRYDGLKLRLHSGSELHGREALSLLLD